MKICRVFTATRRVELLTEDQPLRTIRTPSASHSGFASKPSGGALLTHHSRKSIPSAKQSLELSFVAPVGIQSGH